MKSCRAPRPEVALTLLEVIVIIVLIMILAAVMVPELRAAGRKAAKITCTGHLMNIGLSYRIWQGDHGDINPTGISVTNGGSMEMIATGNVVQTFLVLSNELSTPRLLFCPSDMARIKASSFTGLANSNISYFVAVDVTNDANPQAIVSGDANFEINGQPVAEGLQSLRTNDSVSWSTICHDRCGNLALGDGSVLLVTSNSLLEVVANTGFATNRLAIP